jgi:hypothetical protein
MISLSRRQILSLAAVAALSLGIYLLASTWTYRIGFPLDDAWIHQTYARNLAQRGEWAFVPGQPSAGSTSPLWSLLLAVGYVFHIGPYVWTFFLGWTTLFGLAWLAEVSVRRIWPDWHPSIPWVGILICLEWHLVWAALSGMETLLSALIVTAVLLWITQDHPNFSQLGIVCGLSVWVRPDLITLAVPVGLALLLSDKLSREGMKKLAWMAAGVCAGLIPYLVFNRLLAGQWWPNTFYAKQAEYASLQQIPWIVRFLSEIQLPLVGVGALLLPGVIGWAWHCVRQRDELQLAGMAWWLGYAGLYAWRLPVTYQHGRYIMPIMPIFFVWGVLGYLSIQQHARFYRYRVIGKAWVLSTAVVLVLFWGIVMRVYAQDVAIIETEMVNPAKWVAAHTQPGAIIAAHDIGALGFFGEHPILDMAGLISPQVIPVMGNEQKMANFLDQHSVNYLILTFDWYPGLRQGGQLIYQSDGIFAPAQKVENTRVYRWGKSK